MWSGSSQRPELLHAKLSKIIHPKKSVASKDVERAIAEWERDIEVYRFSKPEYIMEADQRLMLLTQLCPANLQVYLRMKADGLTDYDKTKMIIHDWLGFSENNPHRPGKVAALEQIIEVADGETEDGEQDVEDVVGGEHLHDLKLKKIKDGILRIKHVRFPLFGYSLNTIPIMYLIEYFFDV